MVFIYLLVGLPFPDFLSPYLTHPIDYHVVISSLDTSKPSRSVFYNLFDGHKYLKKKKT